eukprot:TRINITY_DN5449_c0_g1_i1.p1 TRINITY_DN5449_c0_g1~~TRINITY_DN5449_c0_g1_i1.p1  ORF type:complete len:435 (+),score=41.81 TRINITY_DN5449_c0_g1_i1:166-1470(+)
MAAPRVRPCLADCTRALLFLFLAPHLALSADSTSSSSCPTTFSHWAGIEYNTCATLSSQGAKQTFTWTFDNHTRIVRGVYVAQPQAQGGWTAWGINANGIPNMVTSSVLICFPDEAGVPVVKQYILTNQLDSGVQLGGTLKTTYTTCYISSETSPPTYYLKFKLNVSTKAKVTQIWGAGPSVDLSTFHPAKHTSTPVGAFLDFRNQSGTQSVASLASPGTYVDYKEMHATLNVISWGVLLPLGIMTARYFKCMDPSWYYGHIGFQVSAFLIGLAGFITGLALHKYYESDATTHGSIGISMFTFACLQVCLGIAKPNKKASYRLYWNIAHWLFGYLVLVLAIINIFKGFDLLKLTGGGYAGWKNVYIGWLVVLLVVFVVAEVHWAIARHVFGYQEEEAAVVGDDQGVKEPMKEIHMGGDNIVAEDEDGDGHEHRV